MDSKKEIFTLTSFTPVGYKCTEYENVICFICRGPLIDDCPLCIKKTDNCPIIKIDDLEPYCHKHCYELMKKF